MIWYKCFKNRPGNDAPLRGACLLPLQHTRSHRQYPRGDQDEHDQDDQHDQDEHGQDDQDDQDYQDDQDEDEQDEDWYVSGTLIVIETDSPNVLLVMMMQSKII